MYAKLFFVVILFLCTKNFSCIGQNVGTDSIAPPKLFINCTSAKCYEDYLKTELSFFDFVRDRFEADVQLLLIDQENGAGGRLYTITFLGQNQFKNQNDTLKFATKQADTEAMIRTLLLERIKQGLVQYVIQTSLKTKISVDFPQRSATAAMVQHDKWNYWVFNTSLDTWLNGETNRQFIWLAGTFSANRVTPKSKLMTNFSHGKNFSSYTIDDKNFEATTSYTNINLLYVKTITEKWSIGGFYRGFHSIFRNIDWANQLAPAVEYNVFPTSQNTRRQFRWIYQIGGLQQLYLEETVFDKRQEILSYHQLTSVLAFTQPWGTLQTTLNASQFLHDASKYRVGLNVNLSWRVIEGLQVGVDGNFTFIKDQISLAKSAIDPNSVLLDARQLPTNMSYYSGLNISYTFGSINNSVVNPRFNGTDF